MFVMVKLTVTRMVEEVLGSHWDFQMVLRKALQMDRNLGKNLGFEMEVPKAMMTVLR